MTGWNRSRWNWSISVVVLGGALLATSVVGADDDKKGKNPFTQILEKLDQIISKLDSGSQEGNHTLRWDRVLPAAQRFIVLGEFGNASVLDQETGLVWEKSPRIIQQNWTSSRQPCAVRNIGGRLGWRLPSFAELSSLIDPSVPSPGPTLPAGHPFVNVESSGFWSASIDAASPANAWAVDFISGSVANSNKSNPARAWCVRGPMQESVY